ncbi:hypothetical protein Patl1_07980 [Pistacia atlantica]|uniref:Uncharacterized protein n=1 Tax=Pistacia atlantica TaxID=434234 RepID=A0ACC1AK25_9ROSI|nr:hypothetical protein Patl1_07980 [Pistacia atlantica]
MLSNLFDSQVLAFPATLLTEFRFLLLVVFTDIQRMAIESNELIPSSSPEELKKVLQAVASEWGDVIEDMDALQATPLKGALTNEVYQINWPAKNGSLVRKVLVRIYGEGVGIFFNRDDEIKTFECMSRHGQGPQLLGRFSDGRIEQFIHARVCKPVIFFSVISSL